MGHFLAVTAFHTTSPADVQAAISEYCRGSDCRFEVVEVDVPADDRRDAQIYAPVSGWTVVLWPTYFNVHDFPMARAIGAKHGWLVATVHVYDGDYWEHLAVQGADDLHSYCSCPSYWDDEAEQKRVEVFNPDPSRLAQSVGVTPERIRPYLVDIGEAEDAKAFPTDEFSVTDFWVFTDFWRAVGITYPNPPGGLATVLRLETRFDRKLPTG